MTHRYCLPIRIFLLLCCLVSCGISIFKAMGSYGSSSKDYETPMKEEEEEVKKEEVKKSVAAVK